MIGLDLVDCKNSRKSQGNIPMIGDTNGKTKFLFVEYLIERKKTVLSC